MLTFTNFKTGRVFNYFMAVCFLALGSLNTLSATTTPDNLKFSGEDLVRGILLLEGPVADALPEFRNIKVSTLATDSRSQAAIHDFNTKVINQMNRDNPRFMASFKAGVTSGNHAKIYAAIQQGSEAATAAIEKVNGGLPNLSAAEEAAARDISNQMRSADSASEASAIAQEYVAQKYQNQQGGNDVQATIAVAVAVHAVAVAVATEVAFWFWSETVEDEQQSRLFRDQIVNSIAKRL